MKLKNFKRILSLFISILMVLSMIPMQTIVSAAETPSKNSAGYYELDSVDDLYWFAEKASSANDVSIKVALTADITVNENVLDANGNLNTANVANFTVWEPICNGMDGWDDAFNGIFDGQGHTISGLYHTNTERYSGFFEQLNINGVIRNLKITDSYFEAVGYAGSVCSYSKGTIENCYSSATVCATNERHSGGIAGLVGSSTMKNCGFTGKCVNKGYGKVAGLVGHNYANLINCYYAGTDCYSPITNTTYSTTFTNCYYISSAPFTDQGTAKSKEKFNSGEVAYLLNSGVTDGTQGWYQTVGEGYPMPFGDAETQTVYSKEEFYCDLSVAVDYGYYNTPQDKIYRDHDGFDDNGVCTRCGYVLDTSAPVVDDNSVYQISTAGELLWFAQYVNNGNPTTNAVLLSDIDLSGYDWKTICETGLYYNAYGEDLGYSGTFDGNGHKISNVTVKSSTTMDASCGLFGTVSGEIKNLGIDGFTFVDGGKDIRAGAIVGQLITANGKVSNCYVNNATINPGEHVTGGIVGCVYDGTIENCYVVNSTITGTSSRYGYIVGDSRGDVSETDRPGTITNCYTDNATVYSGRTGNITNCETKTAEQFASGEVAYLLNNSITDGTQIFYQTCGEGTPSFSGETVYYGYITCLDSATKVYTNLSTAADTKPDHTESTAANCIDVAFCNVCNSGFGSVNAENHTGELKYVDLEDGTHIQRWNCCKVNVSEAEAHNFEYIADGDTITAKCEICGYEGSVTLNAPKNIVYDGSMKEVTVSGEIQGVEIPAVTYMKDGNVVEFAADAGIYTASISMGDVTAEVQFEIDKIELSISFVDIEDFTYSESTIREVTGVSLSGIAGADNIYVDFDGATVQATSDLAGEYTTVSGLTEVTLAGEGVYNYCLAEYDENTVFSSAYKILQYSVSITPDNQTIEESTSELAQDKYKLDTELPEGHTLTGIALAIGDNDTINVDVTNAVVTNAEGEDVTGSFSFETNTGKVYYYCVYNENGFCKYCDSYEPATLNENGYYEIDNAGKLYWFAQKVNNGSSDINAVLTKDIVVNRSDWTPIANYNGIFDGQYNTISDLACSSTVYAGLFESNNGTVKNLGIVNSTFEGAIVGAVAAENYGTIENCYNASTVTSTLTDDSAYAYAGGICGSNFATISNCHSVGEVTGDSVVGGICGRSLTIPETPDEPETPETSEETDEVTPFSETEESTESDSVVATVTNCYYLADSETDDIDGTTAKTADQFASGEVAYLLNSGVTDGTQVWYQNIEGETTDAYPSFEGATVYYTEIFPVAGAYTNENYQIIIDSDEYFPESDYTGESIVEGLKSVGFGYSFADRQAVAAANGISNYTGTAAQNTAILNLLKAGTLKRPGTIERICDGNGEPLTGWVTVGGVDYYFELPGIIKTGWTVIDETGVRCYFDENGQYVTNTWMADGSNWRYLGEDGAVVTNQFIETDGVMYYVDENGLRTSGWKNDGTTWYYFDADSEYKATMQSVNVGEDFFGMIHINMEGHTDMVISLNDDTTSEFYGQTSIKTFANDLDQNWRFVLQEDGSYKIINMENKGCLEAEDGKADFGVDTYPTPDKNDNSQKWIFVEQSEGVYYIIPVCSIDEESDILCGLDVNDECTDENYRVSLSLFHGNPNQQFTIEPHTDLHIYDDNGFCFCDAYEPAEYVQGTDEFENTVYYFEVENAGQLFWFAEKWNDGTIFDYAENGFESVKITSDIELNPGYVFNSDGTFTGGENPREWTPIKNYEWRYFDGQNHTISGLYVNQPETDYVGLLGSSYYYDIKNLTLTNGYVSGNMYVGSFMGYGDSPINNCISDVTVVAKGNFAGGLAGYSGDVNNSINYGSVTTDGSFAGGIAGDTYGGSVYNCINKGDVTGASSVAGVMGGTNGNVYNSYNIGTVTATSENGEAYGITGGTNENSYYLADAETEDGGKTADQFASGEVTYLLNANDANEEDFWFQTCGEGTPSFSGETVYYGYISCSESAVKEYTNLSTAADEKPAHTEGTAATCLSGAVCSVCNEVYTDVADHTEGTPATCYSLAVCEICEEEYGSPAAHTPDENKVCTMCGKTVYNVSFDVNFGIEYEGDSFAVANEEFTAKLTRLPYRVMPSDNSFAYVIKVNGEAITEYSIVNSILTIPAEYVTGDISIGNVGTLEKIDIDADYCPHIFAGNLTPHTVDWSNDYGVATITAPCAFCGESTDSWAYSTSEKVSNCIYSQTTYTVSSRDITESIMVGDEEILDHVYTSDCDTTCDNNCGETRETTVEHTHDNACDTDCNVCGDVREVPDHVYDNDCDIDCNVCGDVREVSDHVYDNDCDTDCNECGNVREITHSYENGICTVCGDREFELGDVNCDGEVTISDATAIQKHLARIETLSEVSQMLADVNGDGKISVRDVTYIQMFVVKMITEFPASTNNDSSADTENTESSESTTESTENTTESTESATEATENTTESTESTTDSSETVGDASDITISGGSVTTGGAGDSTEIGTTAPVENVTIPGGSITPEGVVDATEIGTTDPDENITIPGGSITVD